MRQHAHKGFWWSALTVVQLVMGGVIAGAAEPAAPNQNPDPDEIIRKFSERESEFRAVWQQYTYTQTITFQILNRQGDPTEKRQIIYEVYFTTDGERKTRKVADRGGLSSLIITKEDLYDATNMQPFVLTAEDIAEYRVEYVGPERVDELDTYVFEVKPRKMVKGKRYFKGRVWVDSEDLQIVMSKGKIEPELGNNKFPKFETVREQIDGAYWFPTWTLADDVLSFSSGYDYSSHHIQVLMTYENFKRYEVGTSIKYGPTVDEKPKP